MTHDEFPSTLTADVPPAGLTPALAALWWDAKGDWDKAHALVNELDTRDAMGVHAYLHRKEGSEANANYWYARAGRQPYSGTLEEEWRDLVKALVR